MEVSIDRCSFSLPFSLTLTVGSSTVQYHKKILPWKWVAFKQSDFREEQERSKILGRCCLHSRKILVGFHWRRWKRAHLVLVQITQSIWSHWLFSLSCNQWTESSGPSKLVLGSKYFSQKFLVHFDFSMADFFFFFWCQVMPGESHGQRSLAGCSPWVARVGHDLVTEPPPPPMTHHHFIHSSFTVIYLEAEPIACLPLLLFHFWSLLLVSYSSSDP